MISENDLNILKEASTNEEEKTIKEEELPITLDIKEEDKEEEEESDNEKEKEKHDVSLKSENELDTPPLLEQSPILEGKRSRKPTLRLEISESLPLRKEVPIPQGRGKPLGEIEYINYQITHASTDALSHMRNICFGRRGYKSTIRRNLREFNGFEFERYDDEYQKHLNHLIKLKKDQLHLISNILGLSSSGRNTEHAERILLFLLKPVDEGKRLPEKKLSIRTPKKRSTTSKESVDKDQETKKQKDEQGSDYIYKPGKKRSSDQQTSTDIKRKKGISKSKENEEIVKVNENDIEKPNQTIEDVI